MSKIVFPEDEQSDKTKACVADPSELWSPSVMPPLIAWPVSGVR